MVHPHLRDLSNCQIYSRKHLSVCQPPGDRRFRGATRGAAGKIDRLGIRIDGGYGSDISLCSSPPFTTSPYPPIAVLVFLVLLLVIIFSIGRLVGSRISISIGLYSIFFTTNGLIFLFIVSYLLSNTPLNHLQFLSVFGIYIFAWLIGFITPGAPAGVGIREVVLFNLIKSIHTPGFVAVGDRDHAVFHRGGRCSLLRIILVLEKKISRRGKNKPGTRDKLSLPNRLFGSHLREVEDTRRHR